MSAGTGIYHSELNASETEPVKFLQIWVIPMKLGIKPRYEKKAFPLVERNNQFEIVVSPDGREGSVIINQNAFFSLTDLKKGTNLTYERKSLGNGLYLFVLNGQGEIDGQKFSTRDGIALNDFEKVLISAATDAELLLMEVPV